VDGIMVGTQKKEQMLGQFAKFLEGEDIIA
jgi:hypothetical protein